MIGLAGFNYDIASLSSPEESEMLQSWNRLFRGEGNASRRAAPWQLLQFLNIPYARRIFVRSGLRLDQVAAANRQGSGRLKIVRENRNIMTRIGQVSPAWHFVMAR